MLRNAGIGILVLGTGLFLMSGIGLAGQPSMAQWEGLQKEVVQTGKIAAEAKELSVDTALRAAEFKEIVLAKLGLWRAKMAEGLMTTIEAREIARRAEEQMKINKKLQGDMATLRGDVTTLQGDMTTVQEKVKGHEKIHQVLKKDVKDLQTSVSVAKEMAATAKMEADQAKREIKQLARQTQEKTDLLFAKLNNLEKRVRALEQRVGKKPLKLKPKKLYPVKKIGKLYEVKKGESLWRISGHKDVYNDPSKWKKIYEANKNKIANPNVVYPGQRLVIPPE